jgi:hypothetical protein
MVDWFLYVSRQRRYFRRDVLAELMQPAESLLDAVNLRSSFLAIPGCTGGTVLFEHPGIH